MSKLKVQYGRQTTLRHSGINSCLCCCRCYGSKSDFFFSSRECHFAGFSIRCLYLFYLICGEAKQHAWFHKVTIFAANHGNVKSSSSGTEFDMIFSPKRRQEKAIGMKAGQAPEQTAEVGSRFRLHHLPAFCYCSLLQAIFFIASLQAVSFFFRCCTVL